MIKGKYDKTHRQMKKAGIKAGIATRKGEWELERAPKTTPGKPKKRGHNTKALELVPSVKIQLAKDRASGMSEAQLAHKYSISESYVHDCLHTLFVRSSKAREILKDVLYNNAIVAGMRVRETVDQLTPMQAVIATGVMTQRAIELDKFTQGVAADVDFSQLAEVGDALRELRGHVALPSDSEGDFIEIQAEVVD